MHFKLKSLPLIFLSLLFIIGGGCKKSEKDELNNSALKISSHHAALSLIKIHSLANGGFVVVSNTFLNGNQDIWIMCYDEQFQLKWERIIGSVLNDNVRSVASDNNGNILIGGGSLGYGREKDTLAAITQYDAYFVMLNSVGETVWQKSFSDKSLYNGEGTESVQDICNDNDTGFTVCGYSFIQTGKAEGWLLRMDLTGHIRSALYKPDYLFEAIFNIDSDNYILFGTPKSHMDSSGFMQIKKNETTGSNKFHSKNIQFNQSSYSPEAYKLKITGDYPEITFMNVINNLASPNLFNKQVKYAYNVKTSNCKISVIDNPVSDLSGANITTEENILLTNNDGFLYLYSLDMNLISSYSTGLRFSHSCKLKSGNYVMGNVELNKLYLMFLDKNGKKIIP